MPLIRALAALLLFSGITFAQDAPAASGAANATNPAPVPMDQKGVVSITIKGAPVQSVIESIVLNGNYDFVTSGEFADTVNLSLSGVSIAEALDTLTGITGLEYRVQDRIITLYGKNAPSEYTRVYKLAAASASQIAPEINAVVQASAGGGGAGAAGAGGGAASPLAALAGAPGAAGAAGAPGAPAGGGVIVDRIHNQLIISAKPSVHRRIEKILQTLDVAQRGELTRFRVFELKYISADLLKNTIKFQLPGFQDNQFLELSGAAQVVAPPSVGLGQTLPGAGGAAAAAAAAPGGGGTPGANTAGGVGATQSLGVSAEQVGTSNTRRVLVTETEENLNFIAKVLLELDRPLKQIYAEITLMKVSRRESDQFGAGVRGMVTQAGRQTPLTEFFSNLGSGATGMQLRFGTIGPEQFSVLFDYLKSKNRGEVVASPRMLVQEGQEARINITQQFPVVQSEVVQGVPISRVTFVDVGTILRFTPSVFADGTVRLAIAPEISNVIRTVALSTGEVPVKDSNIINTVLNVRNGHTAIIGGLKAQNLSKTFDSQPFLGRIPIVGRLFHRHSDSNEVNDLIFSLTPRVVEQTDYHLDAGKADESFASLKHRFVETGQGNGVVFEDKVLNHFYGKDPGIGTVNGRL